MISARALSCIRKINPPRLNFSPSCFTGARIDLRMCSFARVFTHSANVTRRERERGKTLTDSCASGSFIYRILGVAAPNALLIADLYHFSSSSRVLVELWR